MRVFVFSVLSRPPLLCRCLNSTIRQSISSIPTPYDDPLTFLFCLFPDRLSSAIHFPPYILLLLSLSHSRCTIGSLAAAGSLLPFPHFHYSPCIPLSEQPRIRPVALSTIPLPAVLRRDIGCTIAARQSKNFPYTLPNIAKSPAPPPALHPNPLLLFGA